MFFVLAAGMSAQEETGPEKGVALFNAAQDLHEKGDLKGAIDLYKSAIKALPEFPEAEYQLGSAYLAVGSRPEAEAAFRQALVHRPDWPLAVTALGSLLSQNGPSDEGLKLLEKAVAMEPANAAALTALTELRIRSSAGAAVLEPLLAKIRPLTNGQAASANLWNARAALEAALGQKAAAKDSLSRALSIDPKNSASNYQLAEVALMDGDLTAAEGLSAGLPPNQQKLLRAKIAAAQGRYKEALQLIESDTSSTAVDLRSKIAAVSSVGTADLEKRLAENPKDITALSRLCLMYRRTDPGKALDHCRRASDLEPNNIDHAVGFGGALVQAKQFETAVTFFQRLIGIAPQNATAHANLATALFQLKRYAEAKAEFTWMINAQPSLAGPYFFLGIVNDELQEYPDALANYQQYLRLADPKENELDIGKVKLRLPQLQRLVKDGKGKKTK